MAAVGGIISAVGSLAQGAAGAAQAGYQAKVAENNAIIARQNAQYQSVKGSREEEAFRIKSTNLRSTQRAAYSTSGVDVNVGSPKFVQQAAKVLEEFDAMTIRNNTWREVADFERQATNFEAQAQLHKMEASNAMLAGGIGALSAGASAFGSVSGKWSGMQSGATYQPVSYGPSTASAPMSVPIVVDGPRPYNYLRSTRSPGAPIPGTMGI